MMEIKWLGHACFLLEADNGIRLITDPYESGAFSGAIGHRPVTERADIVTVSHYHLDHCHADDVKGDYKLIDKSGTYNIEGVHIEGVKSWHDNNEGKVRGKNIIFKISMDNLNVCHFGDLGHILDEEALDSIRPVDIALIPVGGTFTIDSSEAVSIINMLDPKVTIPMHFKNDRCSLDIDSLDGFIDMFKNALRPSGSTFSIDKESLPDESKTVILRPAL